MAVGIIDFSATDAPLTLTRSLRETGFAVLHGDVLPKDLVRDACDAWLTFFKTGNHQAFRFDSKKQDGYFPFGIESAKGNPNKDLKEFFHFYRWGRCPAELREVTQALYDASTSLAVTLLHWVNDYTPDEVAARFSMPLPEMITDSDDTLLRILHYPPQETKPAPGSIRAGAHEDINLITVLPASAESGLEAMGTDGHWVPIPGGMNAIVINTGDMLQMASGGFYPSTTHRVVNPSPDACMRSRVSAPLFLHPRGDVVLKPGVTAGEYLEERLYEIGVIGP